MSNSILFNTLSLLADTYEKEGNLIEALRQFNFPLAAQKKRFYYEVFLGRSPERGATALEHVVDKSEAARAFLCSKEFADKHVKIFRSLFPERRAWFFLHIPKTAGSTVNHSIETSDRFLNFITADFIDGYYLDNLTYYAKTFSEIRNSHKEIFVLGHPTAKFLVENSLRGASDRVFTVTRDPFDLMVSWINYVLTLIYREYKQEEGFVDRRDTQQVRSIIGNKWCSSVPEVSEEVIFRIIDEIIPENPMCATLGLQPSFYNAIDTCSRLGVEVVALSELKQFLKRNKLPFVEDQNASIKFVTKGRAESKIFDKIYCKISEDLKLYRYFEEDRRWNGRRWNGI